MCMNIVLDFSNMSRLLGIHFYSGVILYSHICQCVYICLLVCEHISVYFECVCFCIFVYVYAFILVHVSYFFVNVAVDVCLYNFECELLEATLYLQDDVYVRTCDLQDVNYVFGADLLCHKTWTKHYFKKYEKLLRDKGTPHYPIWWQDIFISAKTKKKHIFSKIITYENLAETIRTAGPTCKSAEINR